MNGRKIDLETWNRRDHFKLFCGMASPCYGADVRMDVTGLVEKCKASGSHFFAEMLYLVTKTLNGIEEFRTRIINGQPFVYGTVNAGYTVMTDHGFYVNRSTKFADHDTFCKEVEQTVARSKRETNLHEPHDGSRENYDMLYFSCTPWLDFTSITQPIPSNDHASASIPRIVWGKYINENGIYRLTMNITVHHALIDGKPLSEAFNQIQQAIQKFTKGQN